MILPQVAKLLGFLLQVYELLSECFVRCRVLLQGAAAGCCCQSSVRGLEGAAAGCRCRDPLQGAAACAPVPLQGALVTMTPL